MGHISCPICDHGSFVDLKLFKKCVGSALSRPMCCLVCNQTVLGLTSLHVHLSQHESGLQATPSNENKHEMELQTIRPDDTNSPHSDDCALPETSHANSYMGRSFESSTEMNIQELQSNEAIPPLDKLDLQDNPLCPDLPEESDEESSTTKFISPCSDDNRPSSRCSFTDLKFPVQANSPSTSSQYSCDECGLMFSSQHFLVWHKDVIHKHSDCFEVSCKLCKKKFPNLETYRNHVRENHNEQRYMCEKCPKTFKLRGSLVVHKRMYHDGTPSICQFCYKKFPSDTRRDFHERRHHASCGKSNTKGKLSQDLELSFPLKRTLQNNSIQKACRNLDNLIQKNACHSKFPENFLSNSSSISTKTSSPLSVPTMANSQTSSSETASFYAEPPTTSQKETNFKEQMKGEKNEGLMNPRIPVTPLEDPLVKLNPGDDHLALESSKSRLNIVDVHEQELLQNVGIVTEKAQSTGTPPGKSYDILLQHSEPRNMDDKMHYSPEKVADTKNVVPLPHCVKNFDSVPELCSFSGNAQINVIVSPDSSQLNTPAIAHTNGSKVEFYSSNSTCPRNQTSKKSRSKPESDSLFKILLEKNVECSKANNLPSSEIHTRQASIAGSPNTREFKKDLDKNHQNQKVGLPAFLGCDGKPWECDVCKKCFTTKYFLKKHKRLHTGETPYMCSECGKTFTFQQSYHKHLLYHSDDKPHVCSYCGRAFKEMSTLHNHVRIHTGEKPFVCETCGKAFRQRVSYLVHRRIHTGVLPYTCHECQKSFRYKVSLRSHKCEKAGRELSSTSTNSPLKETQSESDDLSSRNAHPTVSDFDQNVEENESNFSETLVSNVLFQNPSNNFGITHADQSERSSLPLKDCPINSLSFHTNNYANRDPISIVSNTTQTHLSSQNYTVNGNNINEQLTYSFLTSSNTSANFRHSDPCNFSNTLETQNNECFENGSLCQIFKLTSNHALRIEDLQQLSNTSAIPPPNDIEIDSNDHHPKQNCSTVIEDWALGCKKNVNMSQCDFMNDYYNNIHIPGVPSKNGAGMRFSSSNSASINELNENFPSKINEETPDYPVTLTLSSQTSDSEEEMDGETVFRRLFS